jgi:CBS domain-containing protein
MRANDVMTKDVVCLNVQASIFDAAECMVCARVSAVPVIDDGGSIVGIVSEADLLQRPEIGTMPKKSWLSRLVANDVASAREFVASHSRRVAEVMTTHVVTADEETTLGGLVELMEAHRVKRIPIIRNGVVVGIVSRANVLEALLSREPDGGVIQPSDDELRQAVVAALEKHGWTSTYPTNVYANAGVVHLWGFVPGEEVRKAYRVAAENVAGVKRVKSHLRSVHAAVGMGT